LVPYEGAWTNDWAAARARLTPDWVALADEADGTERRFTFRELEDRASRAGGFLRETGKLSKGDLVCVLSWPRAEMVEVLLACSKLGAVFVPLNTRLAAPEIEEQIRRFAPKALFFEGEFSARVKKGSVPMEVGFEGGDRGVPYARALGHERLGGPAEVGLEDPVMLLQTGGTTGRPKAALVTHRMVLWNAVNTVRDLLVPYDTTITAVPLHHIGGFTYTVPLIFWGGTNVLMRRWDPMKFLDLVERERPTFLFLVPAQLAELVATQRFKEADFSSVRFLTAGGAAMTQDLIQAVFEKGVTQKQGFGMTEMGPGVFALDPWDGFGHRGSIGKPNLLVEARVVKEDGTDSPPGEGGELLLRGPSVFGGYWKEDEETRRAFDGSWLRTGDVVRVDEGGYYYVIGRTKNVIRSGGESIFPEEVERLLQSHPAIAEAMVIGVPDPKWGEVPKALVVAKANNSLTKADVLTFCEGKIARYKVPKYVQMLQSIPKDSMGKVQRAKLAKEFGQPSDSVVG
jgi:fatty-acyl-CoA synthase